MELRDYIRVLRKAWALILAVTIVGIGLGVGLTLLTTKVYQANVQIFASSATAASSSDSGSGLNGTNSYIAAQVQSYTEFATSPFVIDPVMQDPDVKARLSETHRTLTTAELAKKISEDAPADRVLINLHVTDTNPATAATLANALGDAFIKVVPDKVQKVPVVDADGKVTSERASVQFGVVHPAIVPSSPVKPNKVLNIGIGLMIGLLIGIAIAVLREVLDNTVKSAQDFDELGVPLLAQVAFDKRANRTPIAFRGDAHSARSEAYRQLRTNLQFVDVDNPPRVIAVTSAVPGEGKSSTAINLAASLAEAGGRVCLVEADLRRPSIAKALGLVSDVGFTTVVIGKAPVETVLQNAGKNLAVLTCGPIPPNPSELLISQHAKQVIYDIAEKVDFVILDTPPLLPVTDAAEIATIADATILVHRAAKTTRDQAVRSIEALEKVGKRPVGVVLNMVTRATGRYDYEYGYYYAAYRPSKTALAASAAATAAATPNTATATTTAVKEAPQREQPAESPASATTSTTEDTTTTAKSRSARHHRGARRRAAAEAVATEADTDSFTPVTPVAATAAEPVVAVEPAAADLPADIVEPIEEPLEDEETAPVDDEFADEYDEYDDEDFYFDEDAERVQRVADDDTVEFGVVSIDGQEELPLTDRINGSGDEFDEHSFDEALGVKGDDRR